jgi:hypothetical protein
MPLRRLEALRDDEKDRKATLEELKLRDISVEDIELTMLLLLESVELLEDIEMLEI